MSYLRDREEFVSIMTAEGWPLEDVRRLMKLANRAQRLEVDKCNRPLAEHEIKADVVNDDRIFALAAKHGCKAVYDGALAHLVIKVKSGKTNDWNHQGVHVPVRNY